MTLSRKNYEITTKAVPLFHGEADERGIANLQIQILLWPYHSDLYMQEQFQVVLTDVIFDITFIGYLPGERL